MNHYQFFDSGILLPLYRGKGGICNVSKSEEVWHLVLRPFGVTHSVAHFLTGQGIYPLSPLHVRFPYAFSPRMRDSISGSISTTAAWSTCSAILSYPAVRIISARFCPSCSIVHATESGTSVLSRRI